MKSVKGIESFCAELSSDQPSPGGGAASAAAGAIAASLLVMVCGITLKSKKSETDWAELQRLRDELTSVRDELLRLAEEDANAYDLVVDAARAKKMKETEATAREFQSALLKAAEVPMKTAFACLRVVEKAARVAEIGNKSASSDTGVAIRLAEAGFTGAGLNVKINLSGMADAKVVDSLSKRFDQESSRFEKVLESALKNLKMRP